VRRRVRHEDADFGRLLTEGQLQKRRQSVRHLGGTRERARVR
jgi:hypothetical protein